MGKQVGKAILVVANSDKREHWQEDIRKSVLQYNNWYMKKAPAIFDGVRERIAARVEEAFDATSNFAQITPSAIRNAPSIIQILRLSTAPPLARDRLIGLAEVKPSLVKALEGVEDEEGNMLSAPKIPPSLRQAGLEATDSELAKLIAVVYKLLDYVLFPWLEGEGRLATETERHRSATIVADRLCSALANPILRNEQEREQLATIEIFLERLGYSKAAQRTTWQSMNAGTFAFHINVPARNDDGTQTNGYDIDRNSYASPTLCEP